MALPAGDYHYRHRVFHASDSNYKSLPPAKLMWNVVESTGKSAGKTKSLVSPDYFKVKTNRKERRAAEKKKH